MKKKIRDNFRNIVFLRDKYTCCVCLSKKDEQYLDSHHITDRSEMPNGGYVKENGITVCKDVCHSKLELYHISNGLKWHIGLHPNDLYKKINSSKEIAFKKSEKV